MSNKLADVDLALLYGGLNQKSCYTLILPPQDKLGGSYSHSSMIERY